MPNQTINQSIADKQRHINQSMAIIQVLNPHVKLTIHLLEKSLTPIVFSESDGYLRIAFPLSQSDVPYLRVSKGTTQNVMQILSIQTARANTSIKRTDQCNSTKGADSWSSKVEYDGCSRTSRYLLSSMAVLSSSQKSFSFSSTKEHNKVLEPSDAKHKVSKVNKYCRRQIHRAFSEDTAAEPSYPCHPCSSSAP